MSHNGHAAHGLAAVEPAIESSASLVSLRQPSSEPGAELTTPEVAQHLGRSLAWVKRHAAELGGRIVDGAYRFPSIAIEKRRTTVERITLGGPAREPDVGRRTAAVVRMLEAGSQLSAVVLALEEPYDFVTKVRAAWIAGHQADRSSVIWTCRACSRPSDPQHGYCAGCAPHMVRLTEEQRRVLAGQEIPTAIRCACGRVVDSGTCDVCLGEITVAVENGVIVVRAGARVLRELALSLLASSTEAPTAPAPAPTPTTEAPVSDTTREIVASVHQILADARKPISRPENE